MALIDAVYGTIFEKSVKAIFERLEWEFDFLSSSSGINEKDIAILTDIFWCSECTSTLMDEITHVIGEVFGEERVVGGVSFELLKMLEGFV